MSVFHRAVTVIPSSNATVITAKVLTKKVILDSSYVSRTFTFLEELSKPFDFFRVVLFHHSLVPTTLPWKYDICSSHGKRITKTSCSYPFLSISFCSYPFHFSYPFFLTVAVYLKQILILDILFFRGSLFISPPKMQPSIHGSRISVSVTHCPKNEVFY